MNVVPGFTLINFDEWANSAFVQHETLYSEEECLRMFAGDDPDALVYNHLTGVCSKVQGTFDIDVNDLRPDYYTNTYLPTDGELVILEYIDVINFTFNILVYEMKF
mgnify:FL=1